MWKNNTHQTNECLYKECLMHLGEVHKLIKCRLIKGGKNNPNTKKINNKSKFRGNQGFKNGLNWETYQTTRIGEETTLTFKQTETIKFTQITTELKW